MLNSQNTHLIETSYDRLKSRESFQQYRENLAKAGFPMGYIHEQILLYL